MYTEELVEEGIVKEVKDGIAVVSIKDSDKCEECSAKVFCKPGNSDSRNLTVRDPFGVHVGDKVRILISGSKILFVSFLIYGIPLILLLIGIIIGTQIFENNKELFSTLLAFGMISIYALASFIYSKNKRDKSSSYPEIITN